MHDSWKPLVDEARISWQIAWGQKTQSGYASGGGNPRAPFKDLLNDIPSMFRDHCRQLDDEVGKLLAKMSDLGALSGEHETADELIWIIRDSAQRSVEEMRQSWQVRKLDEAQYLHQLAEVTHTRIVELAKVATAKTAMQIGLRAAAVKKEEDLRKDQDFRDRVRTYSPIGIAAVGGLVTVGGWFGGSWVASVFGLIVALIGSLTALHPKHKD